MLKRNKNQPKSQNEGDILGPQMSRRDFLRAGSTVVAVAAVASATVLGAGASWHGKRPSLEAGEPELVPQPPHDTVALSGLPELPPTTTSEPLEVPAVTDPVATSTTQESIPEKVDTLLVDPETIQEGQLIGMLSVVGADGVVIIPDLSLRANLSNEHADEELHKGAFLQVRRLGLNTDEPMRQQGVLGDTKRISTIFAHRVSNIEEDKDDNGKGDGVIRKAFKDLDKVNVGSALTVRLQNGVAARYVCVEEKIVEGVMILRPGGNPELEKDYDTVTTIYNGLRQQDTVEETVQLLACHPPGQWPDRIVRVFKRVQD